MLPTSSQWRQFWMMDEALALWGPFHEWAGSHVLCAPDLPPLLWDLLVVLSTHKVPLHLECACTQVSFAMAAIS